MGMEYLSLNELKSKVEEKTEEINNYKKEISRHKAIIDEYKSKIKESEAFIQNCLHRINDLSNYCGKSDVASLSGNTNTLLDKDYHEETTIKISRTFYINIYTYKVWKPSWSKEPTQYCKCIILNKISTNKRGNTVRTEHKICFPQKTKFDLELLTKYGVAINSLIEEARTLSNNSGERLIEVANAEYNLLESLRIGKNAKEALEKVESSCGIDYSLNKIDHLTSMKTKKDNFINFKSIISGLKYSLNKAKEKNNTI